MKIILAPAKKMRTDTDSMPCQGMPELLDRTEILLSWLREQSREELQKLWMCSDRITDQNLRRLETMDLRRDLTPAILAYDGIAYQYMAPSVFADGQFQYVQEHLYILSGFYGVLRPMDGVTPYRLEMQTKAVPAGSTDLYDFWGDRLYRSVLDESRIVINLASREYSRCIEKYLQQSDRYITCVFGELHGGKVVQKGVYAKMARGEMVRYLAEIGAESPEALKGFDRLDYHFEESCSDNCNYVFLKPAEK